MTNSEKFILTLTDELNTIGIPPRPTVLLSIEREMRRDEPDYSVLEKIISLDVGVAASLLKIARSPLFGNASANVRTIKDALQILGLKVVATAIAGLSLRKTFSKVPNLERFWDASACVAQISAWLASQIAFSGRPVRPEEVYTYGLFRDAGIPVLLANFSDYFETLDLANAEAELSFTSIEDHEYGVNHALIGAKLAHEWELPNEHRDAIAFHHERSAIQYGGAVPIGDVSRYYMAIAQLAEFLHQRATLKSQSHEWDKLGGTCLELLQLTPERVSELYEKMIADAVPLHPEF
jgi:HD-like signal output (HDOD) protein